MSLTLARVILYVKDVPALAAFYRDVLGLAVEGKITKEWAELDAGGCRVALHGGGAPRTWRGAPRLAFASSDVAATREALIARGASLGKVKLLGELHLCDGKDPEGNAFQISNRR